MVKKYFRMVWLCCLSIAAIAGCDSTNNIDSNNLQLSMTASPTAVLALEYSTITATLNNVATSVSTGTSTTTSAPVAGYAVVFKIARNASDCTLTVVNNITDATGTATAIYQAGSVAGTDIIQASIDSGQTASASVIVSLTATPTPTPSPTP